MTILYSSTLTWPFASHECIRHCYFCNLDCSHLIPLCHLLLFPVLCSQSTNMLKLYLREKRERTLGFTWAKALVETKKELGHGVCVPRNKKPTGKGNGGGSGPCGTVAFLLPEVFLLEFTLSCLRPCFSSFCVGNSHLVHLNMPRWYRHTIYDILI